MDGAKLWGLKQNQKRSPTLSLFLQEYDKSMNALAAKKEEEKNIRKKGSSSPKSKLKNLLSFSHTHPPTSHPSAPTFTPAPITTPTMLILLYPFSADRTLGWLSQVGRLGFGNHSSMREGLGIINSVHVLQITTPGETKGPRDNVQLLWLFSPVGVRGWVVIIAPK